MNAIIFRGAFIFQIKFKNVLYESIVYHLKYDLFLALVNATMSFDRYKWTLIDTR